MYVRRAIRAADPADSHVQARTRPETAGRSTSSAGFPLPVNEPASTTGPDSPHTRHAQAPSRRSTPVHLPSTRDAPSMYFPQTAPPGNAVTIPDLLHQTQTHPIAPSQHQNDTRRKSRSARPDARICDADDRTSRTRRTLAS